MTPPPEEFIAEQMVQSFSRAFDLYLYLAEVKTHLANHHPMTDADEQAWRICHELQETDVML